MQAFRGFAGDVLRGASFGDLEPDRILTENWNRPQFPGKIDPASFTPYPKNPIIAKFFVNIGLADTLGSGTRNLYTCSRIYCGGEPSLEEGDVFRIFVPLKVDEKGEVNRYGLPERQQKILSEILANPRIQVEELMEKFDLSRSTILREIQEIKKRSGLVYDKKSQTWVQK